MKKFFLISMLLLTSCSSINIDSVLQDIQPTQTITPTNTNQPTNTSTITPSPTFTITPSPTFTLTPSPTATPIKIGLDSWQALELLDVYGYGEIINVSYSNRDMPFGVGFNHGVLFFDPKDNKELGSFSSAELLTNLTVSPDGKFGVVSVIIDKIPNIIILDTQTGDVIERISDIEYPILHVEFSSTGKWLASGGINGIDIWDTSTWKITRSFEGDLVNTLDFSNNDKYLASINKHNFLVWDLTDEVSESPIFSKKFINPITSLSFHPDNNIIALVQDEGNIFLFDIDKKVETTRWKDTVCESKSRKIFPSVLFIKGGTQLASSCDNRVIVWDVFTKKIIWDKNFPDTFAIQISQGPDDLSIDIHYIRENNSDNIVFSKIISFESTSGAMVNELNLPTYSWCLGGNGRQFFDDLLAKLKPIWGASHSNKYINTQIPDLPGYFKSNRIVKSYSGKYIAYMYTSLTYKSSKLIIFDSSLDLSNVILSLDIEHKSIVSLGNPIFNNQDTLVSFSNGSHILTYEVLTGNLISDIDLQPFLPTGYNISIIGFGDKIYTDDGLLIISHDSGLYFINPLSSEFLGNIFSDERGYYLVLNSDGSKLALTSCGGYLLPSHINWQSDRIITIWGINPNSEK